MDMTGEAKNHGFLIKILKKRRSKAKKFNKLELSKVKVKKSKLGESLDCFKEAKRDIANETSLVLAIFNENNGNSTTACKNKYGNEDWLHEQVEEILLEMQTSNAKFVFSSSRSTSETSNLRPRPSSRQMLSVLVVPRHFKAESKHWLKEKIKRHSRSVIENAVWWNDLYRRGVHKRIQDIADAFGVSKSTVSKTMSLLKASATLIDFARNNPGLKLSLLYELYQLELTAGSEVALDIAYQLVEKKIKRDEITCLRDEIRMKRQKKAYATSKCFTCDNKRCCAWGNPAPVRAAGCQRTGIAAPNVAGTQ